MGADAYGRDIFSRLVYGTRLSLFIGITAVGLGGVVGTTLGLAAGYFKGRIDVGIGMLVDTLMSFPSLVIGIMVMAFLGGGLWSLIIALGTSLIPQFIRLARSYALTISENVYIDASKSIGCSHKRILLRHMLPNLVGPMVATSSLYVTQVLRDSAALHFIGLGVNPPTATLGSELRAGVSAMIINPSGLLSTALLLVITGFGFNLLGDGLRDIFDPRVRGASRL